MANGSARLFGTIHTTLSRRALAARLRTAGSRVEVRESSLYEGGHYIRVDQGSHFTLERIGGGEYLATADTDSVGPLYEAAARVSAVLVDLGIRHRFEVYDARPEMVHYLHYEWPQVVGG